MARVSKQARAESHERIVDEASRLFREKGIAGTGVAEVMEAAGLTHGGFYRHFDSKEQLADIAIGKALDELAGSLESAIERRGAKGAIAGFIDEYLTERHVTDPGSGCPIAALGAETSREGMALEPCLAEGSRRIARLLAQGLPGDRKSAVAAATGLLATLVGTVIMARAAGSRAQMRKILGAGRRAARIQMVAMD